MNYKKLLPLALLCALCILPARAISPKKAGKIVPHKINNVVVRSAVSTRLANARLKKFAEISALSKPAPTPATIATSTSLRRSVFEVKISSFGVHTASAFALKINGRVWGVTAAHVGENIKQDPYAQVIVNDEIITAPISSLRMGSQKGNDVAIFEIPPEILPHVEVLSPATELPEVATETQSPCFIMGNYNFLPSEDILFAGPHRILLRDQAHQEMTGYCGSPVLVDGKVVGLHIGVYNLPDIQTASWNKLLRTNNLSINTALHVASPIQSVLQLAQETFPEKNQVAGTMLKVLGHPVRLLTPREHVYSIVLIRNGFVNKELSAHPFMNFEKLEEFFELEENDVLRIAVVGPKQYQPSTVTSLYDVNVSTGEVKLLSVK